MNHKEDEKHILFNVQKLFPRQVATDAVEIFLIQRVKSHSNGEKWVHLGDITKTDIVVEPNGHNKFYAGRCICEQIVQFLNEEYWLITLWNLLHEDSKESTISQEILRGFIKHCISEIAKNLVYYGPTSINAKHINRENLPHQTMFYKAIFSYSNIIKEMRKPAKDRMIKKHTFNKFKTNSDVNVNTEELSNLFGKFNQTKYYELIKTIRNERVPKDQRYAINTIAWIYFIVSKFMRDKSSINKAIKNLIESSNGTETRL